MSGRRAEDIQETNREHGQDLDLFPQTHAELCDVVERERQGSDVEYNVCASGGKAHGVGVETGCGVLTVPGLPGTANWVALEDEGDTECCCVTDIQEYQNVHQGAYRAIREHA